MKLSFVEVVGFRGFREKTRLRFPAGFAVLTGRNGSGKSTILDAIDFAMTGTIEKFPVRSARGGGLDQHLWWVGRGKASENYVSVGFIDDDGRETVITRNRTGRIQGSHAELLSRLCSSEPGTASVPADTLMRTTLIRDETIVALSLDLPEQQRFAAVRAAIGGLVGPDYSVRARAIRAAADAAKARQLERSQQAQDELGRALTELTEARSVAERSADVAEALRILQDILPAGPENTREQPEAARAYLAERKRSLDAIEAAIGEAQSLAPELAYLASQEAQAEAETARAEHAALTQRKNDFTQMLMLAVSREATEQQSDAYAAHLSALLQHGSALGLQEGHCPLCAAFRTPAEFDAAIESVRARLASRGERLAEAARAVEQAKATLTKVEDSLLAVHGRIAALERRRDATRQQLDRIDRIFVENHFDADPMKADAALSHALAEREKLVRLERALFTVDSSLAADRIATLETKVAALRKNVETQAQDFANSERAVENARQIENSAVAVANQILTEQFDTVMPLLKELYRRLRPHADWREIESDFGGKVRASLNFTVGEGHNVQFLFSSGQRRAAGLSFLLAIHLSRRWCKLRSLLLDDPVQHIDDYRALNLVEVLAAIRRSGRQVIVAVEDSSLADLLCRRLRSGPGEIGRRFDMKTSITGTAEIEHARDIAPMPRDVLHTAQAS